MFVRYLKVRFAGSIRCNVCRKPAWHLLNPCSILLSVSWQNDITGEHTCIMLRALQTDEVESLSEGGPNWVQPFFQGPPRFRYLVILSLLRPVSPLTLLPLSFWL